MSLRLALQARRDQRQEVPLNALLFRPVVLHARSNLPQAGLQDLHRLKLIFRESETSLAVLSATETVSGSSALAMGTVAAAAPAITAEPLASAELSLPKLQAGVLTALEEASHRTPAERLEEGDWKVQGAELIIAVPVSEKLLTMVFSPEVRKIITSAAATVAAGPVKVTLQSSGAGNGNGNGNGNTAKAPISRVGNGLGARVCASEDPIVKRMQEKFADI